MSDEHDSLRETMVAARQALTMGAGLGPAPVAGNPVDKQLVRRALFPRRAGPAMIGRYRVLGVVGRGAMGVVYACQDDLLGRKVAVKLLHGASAASAEAQERLLREAQALARLGHPNVVAVHDVGTHEGCVYLAMEFVEGQTLRAWLAAAPRSPAEILAVIAAAGEGLAAAHEKGIVHRDVKPDNIMVAADGRVRVMDFGLAREGEVPGPRAAGSEDHGLPVRLTATGAVMGTPAYMAPEQFLGDEVDARSDQFALCATAWEALCGRAAFAGEVYTELAGHVVRGELDAPPPGTLAPWLRRVLERGLAADPARRYPDLRGLLRVLLRDPTPRRRRLVVGGLFVSLLGGAGAAHELAARRELAACDAEAAAILGDWGEAARADLERAFLATGAAEAAPTFARLLPWIDRWVVAWRDAAREACQAGRIDATWDAPLHARALDCLDEARGSFGALLTALTERPALHEAIGAAAELPAPAACVDPALLRERPDLAGSRAAELELRPLLARAGSLAVAGRYAEGLEVAARARQLAEASGAPALRARAELREADLAELTGAYAQAEAGYVRALAAAREAGLPRVAFAAMSELVYVVGYQEARPAEAAVRGEAAATQLAFLAGANHLVQAELDTHLAGARYAGGDYAEAARLYQRAYETRRAELGASHPRVGESLTNLASVRFAAGAYEEAAGLFREALAITEPVLGDAHPQVAKILNNLGMAHESAGAYADARRELGRALEIRERTLGPEHPLVATTLAALGLVYRVTGEPAEASRLLERALAIHEKGLGPEHPKVAEALHNLASVRFDTHDYAGAERLLRRALAIYEESLGPAHRDTASTLAGLALVRHKRGDDVEALRLDDLALEVLRRALGEDHLIVAHVTVERGDVLRALGRAGEAVPSLERALAIREAAHARGEDLAAARFALARALWEAGGDRTRARGLALAAQAAAAQAPGIEEARAEIATWLASHP